MDVVTGLTAVGKAIEIARSAKKLGDEINNAELKYQLAELYTLLADTKMALADAKQVIAEKDAEIEKLKKIQSSKMRTIKYRGYNFGIDENNKSIGRPFCPACEQKSGFQIQISRGISNHDLCPTCKAVYSTSSYPWRLPEGYEIPSE